VKIKGTILIVALAFAVMITACDVKRSELDLRAADLKEGMTKKDVQIQFKNCSVVWETNQITDLNTLPSPQKIYSTNHMSASRITFANNPPSAECCTVYFDTNDVLIAEEFERF